MSYVTDREFLIEVQKGNIPDHAMVHKYGRNDNVASGSWEHISLLPFSTSNFRTSASTVRVKSGGNSNDTAAGSGAREVTIQGIDSNFAEVSETIATAGISASSATTASFWRIHRAWVSAVGTYTGANTGAIIIEDSSGTNDLISIAAGEGQSQYTGWTVPVDVTAYLLSVDLHVDSNKTANIRLYTREDIDDITAPMPSKRLKRFWDGVTGNFTYTPQGPAIEIPEKSDIWLEAYGDGAACKVSCDFELLLVL